ncbi:MBL fold metallo-hydrolase [Hellea balneolensis]|uniref:MBL fold metallo-hydrolase n=1 Tax=Hellea balneolensis TaxID=287478 RepID=UPI00041F23AD|nr:MBL fold metallo-hydrolase [Hellea balneolensis]
MTKLTDFYFKLIKLIGYILPILLVLLLAYNHIPGFKKKVQIAAVDKMGDVGMKRIASNPEAKGSVAAEFINIPIEAREISEGIWQATGVGNAHLITTSGKDVLFDTGLATQVPKQMNVLNEAVSNLELSHIIVSHSHADHSGGTKFWQEEGIEIVAHAEFEEEQRYLKELEPYFWHRNRTLFPFMPEEPPNIGLIATGGVIPTRRIYNGQPYKFSQGGVDFEVHALPGAEGADNIVLWLPQKKILFSGDFFGPLFPQFPNIFTMRGEKIRKPVEYVNSLKTIIALDPDMIVPSHKDPITDKAVIESGLLKIRDATKYVHDKTVEGMNAGKTVEQLMREIELPANLALTQEHGKVSWAVKSIWEYYATWFHFDKTTELYAVPQSEIYKDITTWMGDEIPALADQYVKANAPEKALHLIQMLLHHDPNNISALSVQKQALQQILERAEATTNNSYEIYWLKYRIRDAQSKLDAQ